MDKNLSDLYISEIGVLRNEINENISRSANNENYCAGACAALISYALTRKHLDVISASALTLAVLLWTFGFARYRVMTLHTTLVDQYIGLIEKRLAEEGGWVTWYADKEPKTRINYETTRKGFWLVLALTIVFTAFFLLLQMT